MSILNGNISSQVIHRTEPPFGPRLREIALIPLEDCWDVAVDAEGKWAYAGSRNALVVFDLSSETPREVGRLSGLTTLRQVTVDGRTVYATARQNGLYGIDVSDPTTPRLLFRVDTLELATGVCVANGLCLVTNRHMGVEIWEITPSRQPEYCASFRAGEAQSVCVDGNCAYVGDWMNRRVFIYSIENPRAPQLLSTFQVDGFADGIFVRDGLCLVASGHHSAALKNRRKYHDFPYTTREMLEEGYGCGHGLTLVDVSIPDAPEFLGEIKFPPFFFPAHDTWRVTAAGGYAYAADTHNGVFVVDVSDPCAPTFAGYYPTPAQEPGRETPPAMQQLRAPTVGIACAWGKILAADCINGLHVLDFPRAIPAAPCASPSPEVPAIRAKKVFSCGGQVHNLTEQDGYLLLSCGDEGLYALDSDLKPAFHCQTEGAAHYLTGMRGLLFVAEGDRGVGCYRFVPDEGFLPVGRLKCEGAVRQVVALNGSSRLAIQLDVMRVGFIRVGERGEMTLEQVLASPGMLYHRHLCATVHADRYLAIMPLANGVGWYDLSGAEPSLREKWLPREEGCPIEEGVAVDGERIFLIRARQYAAFRHPAETLEACRSLRRIPGAQLRGIPFLLGDKLTLLNRVTGVVERLDVRNEQQPVLQGRTTLPGCPEFAARVRGQDWIACGHDGLWRME